MEKLTSDQIKWEDGMNWAVVCKKDNNVIRDQYKCVFTKQINKYKDTMICFGEFKYNEDFFYLIKRKDNKKTVVDAVNYLGARIPATGFFKPAILERIKVDLGEDRNVGDVIVGGNEFDPDYCRIVCSNNEFNQCIKEMSHFSGEKLFNDYLAADKEVLEPVQKWTPLVGDEFETNCCLHVCKFSGDKFVISDCHGIEVVSHVNKSTFRKVETQEQKKARERDEMAKKLYSLLPINIKNTFEWSNHAELVILALTDAGFTLPMDK